MTPSSRSTTTAIDTRLRDSGNRKREWLFDNAHRRETSHKPTQCCGPPISTPRQLRARVEISQCPQERAAKDPAHNGELPPRPGDILAAQMHLPVLQIECSHQVELASGYEIGYYNVQNELSRVQTELIFDELKKRDPERLKVELSAATSLSGKTTHPVVKKVAIHLPKDACINALDSLAEDRIASYMALSSNMCHEVDATVRRLMGKSMFSNTYDGQI
jgi:hypothetical protein